jgi:hypothetical protein
LIPTDLVFTPICFYLTRFENKKSKAAFEFSYIIKLFFFRFFNNYGPLYYIAFAKKHIDGCITNENQRLSEENECIWELTYQMIFLFVFYLFSNIFEILIPICKMYKGRGVKFTKDDLKGKSQEIIIKRKVFIEYHRGSLERGELSTVVDEYFEIVIQAGYVFLFSIAFGLIPLLVFFNNMLEMVIDRAKFLHFSRRPIPQSAKSHGVFTNLLETLVFCAIFTNLAIMSFTIEAFGEDDKFTSFIWSNVAIFVIRFIVQEMIPNEPENVYYIRQRHNLIVQRTLGKIGRIKGERIKGERTDFFIKNTIRDPMQEEVKVENKPKDNQI